uniref:DNA replication licensing factor MCM3 n=1 Tax=Alexandrium monilatum TaxID=311494 RepID=A0A7S4T417_9DINO
MAAAAGAEAGAAAPADGGLREREEYEGRVRFFSEFLHANRDEWEKRLDTELANGRYRIPLELRELRRADPSLDRRVLEAPVRYLLPWEEALLSFLRETNEKAVKQLRQPLKLDIAGSFGRNHVTPRGMTGSSLQSLMCVEGVVTKAGLSTPKLLQSMHVRKNADDGHVEQRDHRDQTAFVNQPAAGAMPTHDAEGHELAIEVGLSVYKDYQKFNVQEAPENAPPGQIPRSVEVICEGDLADKAKPGDRVQVIGVYRSFPPPPNDFTNGVWPARLVATSIQPVNEMLEAPFVSDDVRNIREVAARPDAFRLLARSFAPSICGHEGVKEGLLLQMVGGTEKNLANGTHLRGDINVLLVGDPSCGKSQMLRFVMNIAPLAVSTTGRGSSGVGLTAAMIREQGSREFNLEAGAMVRADRGVICIDEFDKMSLGDRVAIHEAMEQQCVTIAKAGMHVTLNARCSVLAAANPIYGTFDPALDLAKNIGLPDSLLSRFDLVYVVRDLTTEAIDRRIATQVLRQAQTRLAGEGRRRGLEQVHSSILERRQEVDARRAQEATEVFEKALPGPDGEAPPEVLTVDFLRKYLRYCRRLTPVLSPGAQARVAEKYVDMRMRFSMGHAEGAGQESKKPRLAVTTRTLEAIIRLATAHAKLRLRKDEVLEEDVDEAHRLLLAAREEEVAAAPGTGTGGDDGGAPPQGEDGAGRGQKRPREGEAEEGAGAAEVDDGSIRISSGRLAVLTTLVARTLARQAQQEVAREELLASVNEGLAEGEPPFAEDEFSAGMDSLEAQNKVMVLETGNVISIG